MIEIKQINFFEYISLYSEKFPISPNFFKQVILGGKAGGIILLAANNKLPLGMAFAYLESSEKFSIFHISIGSEMDCDKIEDNLFEGCVSIAQERGAKVIEYHRTIQVIKHFPLRLEDDSKELIPINHVFSYLLSMSQNNLRQFLKFWDTRGKKILNRLNQKGHVLKQISEVDSNVVENLYCEIEIGLNKKLDVKVCGDISSKYSSIVFCNNNPVAICVVSLDTSKSEIKIEQLFEKNGYRKKGIFLLLLHHVFMMCVSENYRYISFQVNVGNNTMLNVLNHSLSFGEYTKTDYCVYRYVLPQNKN